MEKFSSEPSLKEEKFFWNKGATLVLGVDEAGRGCLAGPVYAATAAFQPEQVPPAGLTDSKLLTPNKRAKLFDLIESDAFARGVGFATNQEIDRWNILRATGLAVARAIEIALKNFATNRIMSGESFEKLSVADLKKCDQRLVLDSEVKVAFLVDGNLSLIDIARFFVEHEDYRKEFSLLRSLFAQETVAERCLVKGDMRSYSIAAASILAKVSRDRIMGEVSEEFPQYEFDRHKGYYTARHKELLRIHGPCRIHRFSFAPCKRGTFTHGASGVSTPHLRWGFGTSLHKT